MSGSKNEIHRIIKSLTYFQKSFLFDFFNKWRMSHIEVIINQTIINHIATLSVNITEEVKTPNFLTSHITSIPNHKLVNDENRNHTSNKPKSTKSTNAVIFANAAKPKNNHAIITYFSISFLSFELFLFWRKIRPANKANKHKAITHKSVLLSTITRNAHIQLVNQSSKIYHHIVIQFQFVSGSVTMLFHFFNSDFSSLFSFLSFTNVNIWKIIAIQNISTRVALMLFIEIAILSEDKPNHQPVQPVREKINVRNWCRNHGIPFATVFHRYIPAFSAKIFGIYMYSWFASQAVEYGTNAFWIHIYRYAKERMTGNNIIKSQIFFQIFSHDRIHIL